MFKPIAIIPHYNHSNTLKAVVDKLLALNLPVLIVDDGSAESHGDILKTLSQQENVAVHFSILNGGKGRAVKVGMKLALQQGFSHAIQVDADGQHNLDDAVTMLAKSQENPTACICGRPIYGDDAPKARLYGRKITDFWNMINTNSYDIKDGMCGFRLYPLISSVKLIEESEIGDWMDFDTEILVKMHWQQIPMIWVDTPVRYNQGGISHFRALRDNWEISKMHARLFFGMLWRRLSGKTV